MGMPFVQHDKIYIRMRRQVFPNGVFNVACWYAGSGMVSFLVLLAESWHCTV